MNDFAVWVSILCVAGLVFFGLYYHTYRGINDSLANARVGSVYNFRYVQPVTGEFERYLAKVISVTKLDDYWLNRLNKTSNYRRYDDMFERSRTLVTCVMKDGTFRQFYGERCDTVRRPLLGGLLFSSGIANLL